MNSIAAISQHHDKHTSTNKKLDLIKVAALKHPYYLGKYVLGYDRFEQIHYDLLSYILRMVELGEDECLDLEPRGCYKTTAVSITLVMWWELKNPNEKILVNHKVNGMSKAILEEIRGHYQTNQTFIRLFGMRIGSINRSGFIVSAHRTQPAKEATISAGSVDKEAVGGHFGKMVNDDIVTLKDYLSEKERKKTEVFYESTKYLAEEGITINVGTRWHEEDLYGKVIIPGLKAKCKRIKPIIDDKKRLYFASKYPLKKINKLRRGGDFLDDEPGANNRLSSMLFNAVMMQKPESDSASKPFANLKYIEDSSIGVYLRSIAYYDPAFSANKASCFNAIPCIASDEHGQRILRDFLYKKLTAAELITDHLPGFIKANDIGILIYEANSAQTLLHKHLEDMIKEHGLQCELVGITNVANKHLRIMAAQPTVVSQILIRSSKMKDTFGDYAQAIVEVKSYNREAAYRDATDALAGAASYSDHGEAGAL